MPELVQFSPETGNIHDTLSWSTDVVKSIQDEGRGARRPVRLSVEYEYLLLAHEYAELEGLIKADPLGTFYVPVWSQAVPCGDVATADASFTAENFETIGTGDRFMLFEHNALHALHVADGSGGGAVTIAGTAGVDLQNAWLVPVQEAQIETPLEQTRSVSAFIAATIRFRCLDAFEDADATYPLYLGEPAISDHSCAFTSLSGSVSQEHVTIGGDNTPVVITADREFLDHKFSFNKKMFGFSEKLAWYKFLNYLEGRHKEFWLTPRSRDFITAAPITATDTDVVIRPTYRTLAQYEGIHICINGTTFLEVSSASLNGSNHELALSGQVGVTDSNPEISLLRRFRSESDAIGISHMNTEAQCQLVLSEVPDVL